MLNVNPGLIVYFRTICFAILVANLKLDFNIFI
jgi:hypothetical protein